MAQDLSQFAGSLVPSGTSMMNFFLYFGLGVIIAAFIATCIYLYIQKKKYNKTIMIFKKVGSEYEWVETIACMFERIGLAGDYWVKCKNGKILSRPHYEVKKNVYFYYEGMDGELRNFKLGDINIKLKEADVVILQEDMRLTRIAIEKNLKDRLQKKSWWEENKAFVTNIILIVIIIVAVMYLFNKMGDLIKMLEQLVKSLDGFTQALTSAYSHIPNLESGVKL